MKLLPKITQEQIDVSLEVILSGASNSSIQEWLKGINSELEETNPDLYKFINGRIQKILMIATLLSNTEKDGSEMLSATIFAEYALLLYLINYGLGDKKRLKEFEMYLKSVGVENIDTED